MELNTAEFYDDVYRTKPSKWSNVSRDKFAFNALQMYFPDESPRNILDFGCGNGHTLEYFKSYWPDSGLMGVDISEVALRLAKHNITKGTFFTTIQPGFHSLIMVMGVAEHFDAPVKELRTIGEHLEDDGLLYLEVPNCLEDNSDEGFRETHVMGGNGAGQHEWHWTRSSWEKTITDAGFNIVEVITGEQVTWEFVWVLSTNKGVQK